MNVLVRSARLCSLLLQGFPVPSFVFCAIMLFDPGVRMVVDLIMLSIIAILVGIVVQFVFIMPGMMTTMTIHTRNDLKHSAWMHVALGNGLLILKHPTGEHQGHVLVRVSVCFTHPLDDSFDLVVTIHIYLDCALVILLCENLQMPCRTNWN